MKSLLTEQELTAKLKVVVSRQVNKLVAAEGLGVSPQFLADVIADPPRRNIGPTLAKALGFEPVTMYRRVTK